MWTSRYDHRGELHRHKIVTISHHAVSPSPVCVLLSHVRLACVHRMVSLDQRCAFHRHLSEAVGELFERPVAS
jgi:hypothetical protein